MIESTNQNKEFHKWNEDIMFRNLLLPLKNKKKGETKGVKIIQNR